MTTRLYPHASKEDLIKQYVGKSLADVPTPSAVLDLSKLKANCDRMLEAVDTLDIGWRAHIKTHKTTELTRLQVGEGNGPANIIVSTLIEGEEIVPLLLEYKQKGRAVNLLYSFPVTPAAVGRLSSMGGVLGPGGLCLMVDHPHQLASVVAIKEESGVAPLIFLKIDMGGHRAGVAPNSAAASELISEILYLESQSTCVFHGLYSHAGQSYSSSNRSDALDFLRQEFEALLVTAETVHASSGRKSLVLSVGATPTTTSIRNLLIENEATPAAESNAISALKATLQTIRDLGCSLEIHAGVYPTLDVQQMATHALPTSGPNAMLRWSDIAFTVLAEVASLYPGRGASGKTEALVGAGIIAMGREPCKAYPGWGMLSPWNRPDASMPTVGPEQHAGWQLGRLSQEHGILVWAGEEKDVEPLKIGQKVRIWPNHACIAGVGFSWYLIVDSSLEGREDEIIDVWPRWRGW
ncbi:hypothetical protein BP5796_06783 [Coleophoma crateriformis]|uniref:D-serine dehydratase n=1 Tax=Coleophoma crateriformis TaxID=565419 RepID=A0A3D8RPE7_9HELO|nr:hypothetical protein BP5796_06783 [Coleophoma crateriformis]